jgi:hypothetical protein
MASAHRDRGASMATSIEGNGRGLETLNGKCRIPEAGRGLPL